MSETQFRKRRAATLPSLYAIENELDSSMEDERERERKDWYLKQLMHSDAPIEKDLIRGAAIGVFDFVQYEELERTSHYSHKKGWFSHTSDEESNSMRVRRWSIKR
jgi:hypothetical protein